MASAYDHPVESSIISGVGCEIEAERSDDRPQRVDGVSCRSCDATSWQTIVALRQGGALRRGAGAGRCGGAEHGGALRRGVAAGRSTAGGALWRGGAAIQQADVPIRRWIPAPWWGEFLHLETRGTVSSACRNQDVEKAPGAPLPKEQQNHRRKLQRLPSRHSSNASQTVADYRRAPSLGMVVA